MSEALPSSEDLAPRPLSRLWFVHHLAAWRGPWSRMELVLIAICPLFGVVGALGMERVRLQGHVMPGVLLDGYALEGYSQGALRQYLAQLNEQLGEKRLTLQVGETPFRLGAREIEAQIDTDPLVVELLRRGRSGNLWQQLRWRLARFSAPDPAELVVQYNSIAWNHQLHRYAAATLTRPAEGALHFSKGKLIRTEPRAGREIDTLAAGRLLESALAPEGVSTLTLPLIARKPATTRAAVDAVAAEARRLLRGPISLRIDLAEGTEAPEEQTTETSAQQHSAPLEHLMPRALGPAIRTTQVDGAPGSLQLRLDPEALDAALQDVRQRWEQPATDARFVTDKRGRLEIVPSKTQTRLPTEAVASELLRAASSPTRTGEVRLVKAQEPRITTEIAQSLGIEKVVSSFTTHHPCCRPRVENIHRIADLIDGTVVLPGEIFSINEHVGPRTQANGFVPAPTIVLGEIEDTIGGGVSQFATTIFNAVFNGGYEIIERQPHSFYFRRYPVGHEATLSFPKPDFIFKNDTKSGVLLKTEYGATYIRVKVYGDNEGRKVKRHVSSRFDITDPPVEYEADPQLDPDEEKTIDRGAYGFSVNVSRLLTDAAGNATTEARKVTYQPRTKKLRVHPCMIPEAAEGHTGEPCPEPEETDAGAQF